MPNIDIKPPITSLSERKTLKLKRKKRENRIRPKKNLCAWPNCEKAFRDKADMIRHVMSHQVSILMIKLYRNRKLS